MPRARPASTPPQRLLQVYAFDPSSTARADNRVVIQVPYEPLAKGPVGRKVAVIDYDASNRCYYEGVDLDQAANLGQHGRTLSEADPQFHQQMVYAVVMDTVRRFEVALGRELHWRTDRSSAASPFHGKLKIFPHAMQEANAFYDPKLRALLFGYFAASEYDAGANLPGQVVFTCLSQDIIIHEATHAILDSIRGYFTEPTGPDVAAFHEAFADIVALLQHFSFKDSLIETIQRTGGLIHRRQLPSTVKPAGGTPTIQAELDENNPMVDLARQFGEAMGHHQALRSALGTAPDPRALDRVFEPHARGAILVAAVFDAFFSCYVERTRDLIRIAYPDGREVVPNFLHADLANRLALEAAETASHMQNICLRALDYCPPVDVTFGDYLRALVTADREMTAKDDRGYRRALINAFRARGIRPHGVISYSEDALNWEPYDGTTGPDAHAIFRNLWYDINRYEEESDQRARSATYRQLWYAAAQLGPVLNLSPTSPYQASSITASQRVGFDGTLQRQIVAELIQRRKSVPIVEGGPEDATFTFYGGTTVIVDHLGKIRYLITKPMHGLDGAARLERQRAYLAQVMSASPLAPYVQVNPALALSFQGIHRWF
jgi:hypothetical protein